MLGDRIRYAYTYLRTRYLRTIEDVREDTGEHLLDELRITLYHEVGHFLGLDEKDLEERGLD